MVWAKILAARSRDCDRRLGAGHNVVARVGMEADRHGRASAAAHSHVLDE